MFGAHVGVQGRWLLEHCPIERSRSRYSVCNSILRIQTSAVRWHPLQGHRARLNQTLPRTRYVKRRCAYTRYAGLHAVKCDCTAILCHEPGGVMARAIQLRLADHREHCNQMVMVANSRGGTKSGSPSLRLPAKSTFCAEIREMHAHAS